MSTGRCSQCGCNNVRIRQCNECGYYACDDCMTSSIPVCENCEDFIDDYEDD